MKKSILITFLSLVCALMSAQTQMLTFEPAVGGTKYIADGKNTSFGLLGGGDIAYTILWEKSRDFSLGIKTGINAYYSSSKVSGAIDDHYTRTDYLGHEMEYTIKGVARHSIEEVRIGVPIMFAMVSKGLTFNLGIKNVLPVMQNGVQDVEKLDIVAYYDKYAVPVSNELITGLALDEQLHQKTHELVSRYALGLSAEVGFVGAIKGGHRLGVLLYVDYFPLYVSAASGAGSAATPLVDVAAITNPEYPVPAVTIHELGNSLHGLQSLAFGIKLIYGIDLTKASRRRHGLH